ncbi:MAG TPA: hypothetical protein VN454_02615, partial [Candidatus Angelobacter sp.]|nr:hypothetical protein [Candidatus Angelobacter sp.]
AGSVRATMADASTPVIGTVRAAMSSMTIGGTGTMIATVIAGKITTITTTTANTRAATRTATITTVTDF